MTKNRPSQNEPLHTEMALPRQLYVTLLGAMCLSGSYIYIIYRVTLSWACAFPTKTVGLSYPVWVGLQIKPSISAFIFNAFIRLLLLFYCVSLCRVSNWWFNKMKANKAAVDLVGSSSSLLRTRLSRCGESRRKHGLLMPCFPPRGFTASQCAAAVKEQPNKYRKRDIYETPSPKTTD